MGRILEFEAPDGKILQFEEPDSSAQPQSDFQKMPAPLRSAAGFGYGLVDEAGLGVPGMLAKRFPQQAKAVGLEAPPPTGSEAVGRMVGFGVGLPGHIAKTVGIKAAERFGPRLFGRAAAGALGGAAGLGSTAITKPGEIPARVAGGLVLGAAVPAVMEAAPRYARGLQRAFSDPKMEEMAQGVAGKVRGYSHNVLSPKFDEGLSAIASKNPDKFLDITDVTKRIQSLAEDSPEIMDAIDAYAAKFPKAKPIAEAIKNPTYILGKGRMSISATQGQHLMKSLEEVAPDISYRLKSELADAFPEMRGVWKNYARGITDVENIQGQLGEAGRVTSAMERLPSLYPSSTEGRLLPSASKRLGAQRVLGPESYKELVATRRMNAAKQYAPWAGASMFGLGRLFRRRHH